MYDSVTEWQVVILCAMVICSCFEVGAGKDKFIKLGMLALREVVEFRVGM